MINITYHHKTVNDRKMVSNVIVSHSDYPEVGVLAHVGDGNYEWRIDEHVGYSKVCLHDGIAILVSTFMR